MFKHNNKTRWNSKIYPVHEGTCWERMARKLHKDIKPDIKRGLKYRIRNRDRLFIAPFCKFPPVKQIGEYSSEQARNL